MLRKMAVIGGGVIVGLVFFISNITFVQATPQSTISYQAWRLAAQTKHLPNAVINKALHAYYTAKDKGIVKKPILSVIDYELPSTEKRLWVFDLNNNKLLYNTYVAHGQNSGGNYATHFSDRSGSHESSIGTFITGKHYQGSKGLSLRLKGLERGFNSHALSRSIVVHGASYVSSNTAANIGRLGRSWGCPAINPKLVRPIINTIEEGSLLFAYYPDKNWLSHSEYL